jgi:hypothetical protein
MYFLPIYIKRYKTKIKAQDFVYNVRQNTLYIYDKDGYPKESNPRGLICRNEIDKTIFLKERPVYRRSIGAVTAIFISESKKNEGELIITSVAFHDYFGTFWFLILIIGGVFGLILGTNYEITIMIIVSITFLIVMNRHDLILQKKFIEEIIKYTENKKH